MVYAREGVIAVPRPNACWIVPTSWDIQVPVVIEHRIEWDGRVFLPTLHFDSHSEVEANFQCANYKFRFMLRELIAMFIAKK